MANYIPPSQLIANSYILCVSAKWLGEKKVEFFSVQKHGQQEMLEQIHRLMDQADVIVHYNGTKFDIPTLNREFLTEGLWPPSPSKQVDLLKVVRKQFRFTSNKLDFVCQRLGIGTKVHHKGMELWEGCMNGDAASWKVMEKYNKHDVVLLEKLYDKLIPWIPNHPNVTMYTGKTASCPRCGSDELISRGIYHSATLSYEKLECFSCGGWSRGERSESAPKVSRVPI